MSSQLLLGLGDALRVDVIFFVLLGVLLGYVVGVLPGLNRPAALAIAVPLSYYMTPLSAVAFLIGIAKASGAGGATTAILINTSGEPNDEAPGRATATPRANPTPRPRRSAAIPWQKQGRRRRPSKSRSTPRSPATFWAR